MEIKCKYIIYIIYIIYTISKYLTEKLENTNYRSKFIATFSEDITVQVENGVVSERTDLQSLHEEADIKVFKQCIALLKTKWTVSRSFHVLKMK